MSKVQVDTNGINVEKIDTLPMDEYLREIAKMKLRNEHTMVLLNQNYLKNVETLELEDIAINQDLQTVIKNRKTILKARLKEENIPLNNLLAEAFPDSFSELAIPIPPIQETVETVDNPLQCMSLIGVYNDKTDTFDKVNCLVIFKSLDELNIHQENHKLEGELI